MPRSEPESATSRRTRALLVDTAIEVLAVRPDATLGEIASAADLSRSTLHRQFANRTALLGAIDRECRARFGRAATSARPTDGTGLAALQRLAQEFYALGPVLGLIFADNAMVDPDSWTTVDPDVDGSGQGLESVIGRGLADGTLDPAGDPAWLETTFWVLLFGAHLATMQGTPTSEVSQQLTRTVGKALGV
ncbi:TetR/AcrR family transcriptional regulator [Propionibacteriaceae bacterium Y2011]|uniref:TetR/AcrR family transcriptional regulator n=1 Tax=Microlunatus sp. Y2014 TaxID=3418488 RepID=UPI003B4D1BB7